MCFRPADAGASGGMNKCPECGKTIQMMAGVTLKACPFCKADFSPYINGEKPLPNAAPGAPAAPAAPGAPKAPAAPGAPSLPPRKRTRCLSGACKGDGRRDHGRGWSPARGSTRGFAR